ncbi:TRAP transporter substrate-binding protein [Noviherbaspirillum sp.]|jgi:TRAP-type C4-dicarboxylate transport system substrate-binding protein|uniref:TRAP transporter substrate-binding protein n=1 Tax=Noviherbaspirillum sp. TaxID=1926288 RepID=UPI0025F46B86|nr:TRAP transporter substrate-binding protein [Noviherbaspirillum sp.]
MKTIQRVMCRLGKGLFLGFFFVMAMPTGVAQAGAVHVDLATAYGADNFHTRNLQQFADDTRKLTNGQVDFAIHAGGSLLKPTDIYAGVRMGKAGAGEVIMSSLSKEHVLFGIDALPFIVSGYEDARRLWAASRPAMEKLLHEQGLQLLYAVPWPPQNLYSRREIGTMKDFKGLSMRSYGPATERIAELIGARPMTIQAVDLEKAIAEEKLDLILTSSSTGVDTRAWTTLKHYYKVSAWIPKNMVFIDRKLYDGLDTRTREKLDEAARSAEERGWRLSQESNQSAENQLAANKVSVSTIDFIIRSYLDRLGETLAREWLKKAGNDELSVLLKYTTERSAR